MDRHEAAGSGSSAVSCRISRLSLLIWSGMAIRQLGTAL